MKKALILLKAMVVLALIKTIRAIIRCTAYVSKDDTISYFKPSPRIFISSRVKPEPDGAITAYVHIGSVTLFLYALVKDVKRALQGTTTNNNLVSNGNAYIYSCCQIR